MTANMESVYWESNAEWYDFDEVNNEYILTEKAPERAIRSFELWKNGNKERPLKEAI